MKLILMAFIFVSVVAQAQEREDLKFQNLISLSIQKGQRVDTEVGTYLVLQSETKDQAITTKEYFSSVGGYDESKVFHVGQVEAVLEKWILDKDGNSVIDQWDFTVDIQGDLVQSNHYLMTETPEHQIIADKDLKPDSYEQAKEWFFERDSLEKKFIR